jgi:GT2 family glycosyltransferase
MNAQGPAGSDAPARCAAWLAPDVVLAVVDLEAIEPAEASLSASIEGSPIPAEARSEWLSQSDGGYGRRAIFIAQLESPSPYSSGVELAFGSGSSGATFAMPPLSSLEDDLRALVRDHLASLDAKSRARIIAFLLVAAEYGGSSIDSNRLSENLALVRDGLRDPHPRVGLQPEEPRSLHIDAMVRVDDRSFFLHGWMRDEQAPIVRLTAVSPEGARFEMLERMAKVRRPDVEELFSHPNWSEEPGFDCFLALDSPSRRDSGWIIELENAVGTVAEAEVPAPVDDPVAGRDVILSLLDQERSPLGPVSEHVLPAIARLQERLASTVDVDHVERFGEAPRAPEVSIVVPLYKRVDLLQHQLAQFASDPELQQMDLIYVLDSPELSEGLLTEAARLFQLYRVPFRIATLSRNGGFAVANNRGASLADGRLLMLLNSDVLPAAPGWLGRLAGFHDATPRIGALGPKLLFEDNSLQHAGLYFRRPASWAAWENAHYFKGLHRDLPAANVARRVPAVTAACLMIDRGLYAELDGLRSIYIQGDYEDSDLCLRLGEAGYENWYRPEVAMYHLEGRSYATAERQANARYNTWLQTSLWGPQIERLMSEETPIPDAASAPTA